MAGVFFGPLGAEAFWLLSTPASGAVIKTVILHDTRIALLEPASNPDPNPFKGYQDIETTEGAALIPNIGPEGTLPDGGVHTEGRISLYVVREGDTLSEIASMFGVTPNTIKWANNIKDLKLISPGDELLILPISGVKHTVKSGDTLKSLAKKYNASAEEIALFNDLDEGTLLSAGEELIIPGGEIVAPKSSVAKSGGNSSRALPSISGFFGNPVPGAVLTQGLHGYNGVDLGAPAGTPVYAAAGGTIIVARADGGWNGGYGNYVVIDHGNGTQTLYSHLSSVSVSVGQEIGKGGKLGGIGRTGRATGNHLHFEVRGAKNPFAQ